MTFKKENMAHGATGGFTNATDLADYLVKCGVPFRSSHEIVGKMVARAVETNRALDEFTLAEMKEFSELINEDIYEAIAIKTCVNERNVIGGPASCEVLKEIKNGHNILS